MNIRKITRISILSTLFLNIFGADNTSNFLKLLAPKENSYSPENKVEIKQDPVEKKTEDVSFKLLSVLVGKNPDIDNCPSADCSKLYKGGIEQLGIEYLDYNRYHDEKAKMPRIHEKNLPLLDRMNLKKYGWFVEQKYEAPWYMKFVNEKVGHGIFAAVDLQEGDFIGEYTGIVYDMPTFRTLKPFDPNYAWSILPPPNYSQKTTFNVDAKKSCNFTRFINHSYDPNVKTLTIYAQDGWHIIYVACKSIKKDEQILANYGENYWIGRTPEAL